jgi:RNA polymerase sigma-70 factor (ECF subfamily)
MTEKTVAELVELVAAGDEEAYAEIVRRFEPELRRAVRIYRLRPHLQGVMDSEDIRQSVFRRLYLRLRRGGIEASNLAALIATIARNRLKSAHRSQHAECRDVGRTVATGADRFPEVASRGLLPDDEVELRDLLESMLRRLSPEELRLLELREQEQLSWKEICEMLGVSAEALRKQLSRALQRIREELGG